ncbi:MAG: thioredoxin [Lewinellaceae bacterium]|nr:thioredoxin [Lewinellaceae bacterium]
MESSNFEQDVLARSYEVPVVVDFWAPWCGPCRILGPTIEQLAEEQEGRWELVKVNTEDHPEIARQYQVMSIPNVKMFRNGKPAAEFVGALPRRAIEQWLDEHIPSGEKLQLAQVLEEAKKRVFEKPLEALSMVEGIALGHEFYDDAEDIRTLAHFLDHPFQGDTPVVTALKNAQKALRNEQWEQAAQQIIEATTLDKGFQNDLPRKTAIALFHLWGDQHPLTQSYRWRFDMALY